MGERIQISSIAEDYARTGQSVESTTVTGTRVRDWPISRQVHECERFLRRSSLPGNGVQARRVEAGVFEVRFVGI